MHGLERLKAFRDRMGSDYARLRNFDLEPPHVHVSCLSPFIRYRLVAEEEVASVAKESHGLPGAEKFIAEVFWRTYFKGWLERRPHVWDLYIEALAQQISGLEHADFAKEYRAATEGKTGIECFDAWAEELVSTGYLHNHARMWFASIWIFSLRLPWVLGADFFLRHLLDGDAAANTLSWRWVAGLHTRGKNYAAVASNIRKYTEGRFNPEGQLAIDPLPLEDDWNGASGPLPDEGPFIPGSDPVILLVHEDDFGLETLPLKRESVVGVGIMTATSHRSPLKISPQLKAFIEEAGEDTARRAAEKYGVPVKILPDAETLEGFAHEIGVRKIVMLYLPTGPMKDKFSSFQLQDLHFTTLQRAGDRAAWPYCSAGFFKLKKQIPKLMSANGLLV